jgi:hypothetical protein
VLLVFTMGLHYVMNGAVPDICTKQEEPVAISIILKVILHLNLNHRYRIVFLFTAVEISNIRVTALHPAPNVVYITGVQYY